jgi:PPM family protein phosphatase
LLAFVKSDTGMVRKTNEDSYIFIPPNLFVVADGMGGHLAGEIASKLAANIISAYVHDYSGGNTPDIMLAEAIHEANRVVYEKSLQHEDYAGMGTTVSAVYVDADKVYWGHVGDSRIYMKESTQDVLLQLTADHSLVWELVERGEITREEANTHPRRNILTRAVGTGQNITVDTGMVSWNQHDALVLCTDGLTNMINETELGCRITKGRQDGAATVDGLVAYANAGGGYDNITIILLQNED